MTTPATASLLRAALAPEALTRARRRLLTAHPDPTSSKTPASGSPTDDQLRVLAASDWVPPRIGALDTNAIATADTVTRALLAESVREILERRLTAERPHGTYDDTRAGHDAFSTTVTDDYDHGNHHLARATLRPADPGLVTRVGLSQLGLPDTDAPIIDELAGASDINPIMRILADAALLDLDRYATGQGLRYSRVGTTLMLAAPNEQRLADAIDTVAATAINTGARLTDLTTQYIDDEKALACVGIDPWATRPSDEPTGQADRILYVGRDGAHMHAWRRSLAGARTLDEIMGIEGACSNAYFDALAGCMPADVTFDGRSRRPPRDLPNAALSYGYAILLSECVGALHAAGLEPSLGVAHAPTDKRPSLALDLMEQFRPLLVDQTVMALLRTLKLRPEHGVVEAEAGGVWLGADGKKILVDAYEVASQRSVTGALPGYSGSWRRHIAHYPTISGAGSPGDDLHHRLRHRRQQTTAPRRQNPRILGLPHPRIRIPTPPRHHHARPRARSARRPHLRLRRRHPHLPHLLILRRPRRHTRRGHSARRCGVV